jgi:uncharacterized protein with GYD domain
MATYIMLANWTEQGAKSVKQSPHRLDAAKKALAELGGEMKEFFMTMGAYDMVCVYDAPDDAAAARFSLQLAQLGNIRTQTLKAFRETEYRNILRALG